METISGVAAQVMDGAALSAEGTARFRVWAPAVQQMWLRLMRRSAAPQELPMQRLDGGYFELTAPAAAGDRYSYLPDGGNPLPDPVSRLLPEGVHGATEIVDPAFAWSCPQWRGIELRDAVIYELHIGTFTPEGTFAAAREKLDHLRQLGVTVIEVMPVAAFPGTRNWGYDGVAPYAVQASYGGPAGFKAFVDAAHRAGLAVMLDVVYNHLGNEGNYLRAFGPYFTARHKTPWGDAINFDGPDAAPVRAYFVQNACYWIREYQLDGLRLDATQTIADDSPRHILREIADAVREVARQAGRQVLMTAETDENEPRYVSHSQGGYALDAIWSDDFHHAMHRLLTGEDKGYYQDFGRPEQLQRALEEGFVFQGEPFAFWGGPRGASATGMPLPAHIFCIQNHDQVGNRATGERLTGLAPRGARKMAAAVFLLAPQTPLLFMGQEFDEENPFQYFTNYSDAALARATSEGRRREFKDFTWEQVPDPEDAQTFARSRLNWQRASMDDPMLRWYRDLLALRKELVTLGPRTCRAQVTGDVLTMQVPAEQPRLRLSASLRPGAQPPCTPQQGWSEALSSSEDGYTVRIERRTAP